MSAVPRRAGHPASPGDLAGGLICAIVCVPYAASYAALLFTGPLGAHLGAGISVVLLTAVIGAALSAFLSSFPFGVTNPDVNTTAVLAVVLAAVAEHAAEGGGPGTVLPSVLATAFLAALVTGGSLLALGSFRAGRWVRFIPYPVMGGYLAATGWLIAMGSLKVALGAPVTWQTVREMAATGPDPRLVAAVLVGLAFMVVQRRVRSPLGTPILLVVLSALTFGGLAVAGLSVDQGRAAGWLFGELGNPQWFAPWNTLLGGQVDWGAVAGQASGLAALVAVAAITNLLTAAGLEVETAHDADLDRELRAGGIANLGAALAGGYVAILSISRTLVAFRSGARSRLTGLIVAVVCAGAALGGSHLVALLPRVALAGLLFAMGLGLLYDWLVLGVRRLRRKDYGVVVIILATTAFFGFALGVAVGVLAACVAFAVDYAHMHVIKRELSGRELRSHFERSHDDRAVLDAHGQDVLVIQFQGFLFFGSAYAILEHLRQRFAKPDPPGYLILDFKAVQGLDSSAAATFQKIRQLVAGQGCDLVLVELAPGVKATLVEAGTLRDGDGIAVTADLDHGLEWCEERILSAHRSAAPPREGVLSRWLERELGDLDAVRRLIAGMERREYAPGDRVFREGAAPGGLYLVESGRVSVVLEREGQPPVRLRTYEGGTVLGEMGFYTSEPRTASLVAEEPSVLLRLSREAFAGLTERDGALASAFHSMIVRVLAHRLAAATAEKTALRRFGTAAP